MTRRRTLLVAALVAVALLVASPVLRGQVVKAARQLYGSTLYVVGGGYIGGPVGIGASAQAGIPLSLPAGAAAAPAVTVGDSDTGLYQNGGVGTLAVVINGDNSRQHEFTGSSFTVKSDSASVNMGVGYDIVLKREAAGTLGLFKSTLDNLLRIHGKNGSYTEYGTATELVTIAAAATTDTSANLLPADAYIESVDVFVVTAIPTAATFNVGDAATAARFATGVAVAQGTSAVGLNHCDQSGAGGPKQTAAAKVRFTPDALPAAATGQVRVAVHYRRHVAPTS